MDPIIFQQFMDSDGETSDSSSSSSEMAAPEPTKFTEGDSISMAKLKRGILDDTIQNIIHDIVAKVHRDEKMARMRSAVVIAKQRAAEEAGEGGDGEFVNGNLKAADQNPSGAVKKPGPAIKFETDGAVYDNGKVYLKGNPLKTTKEIICPDCQLPRLLYPTSGLGSRPPPDPYREYCQKHPPIIKPGCDVHGNLFATDKINPKKKKQQPQQPAADAPASSPPSTPSTPAGSFKQVAPERISFPTVKCPVCPRYFVVTRVAQHLDRCMGGGRQANRNRALQDNGSSATPKPAPLKRARPNGDDEISTTKKKKPNPTKKLTGKKPAPPSKLKNGTTPDMAALENTGADTKKKGSK
ncbi:hypothetical protein FQN54_002348 [Arachnomyces sp. PD_36]|nr:hypothetical protein FQN54_002348 [Arachnomyces sp. PD_36]